MRRPRPNGQTPTSDADADDDEDADSPDADDRRRPPARLVVVVNKIDRATSAQVLERLTQAKAAVEALGDDLADVEYFPVSARSGQGRRRARRRYLSPGSPRARRSSRPTSSPTRPRRSGWPSWSASSCWPRPATSCPHAITCRVTEWEWPHIRVEIIVERDSQKAIVIGKGGEVLKAVGIAVPRGPARGRVPRPAREGGAALAEPGRDARPPRVLTEPSGPTRRPLRGPAAGRPRPRSGRPCAASGGSVASSTPR